MKTRSGRAIVTGAAILGSAAALGELLVSVKTLFGEETPPAVAAGTAAGVQAAPPGTQVAMIQPVEPSAQRHEGPVRVSFMPLKNLSASELRGVEYTLQESGIAGLADGGIAVVERGQLDDQDRSQFNSVFDELVLSNNSVFWDKEKANAFGMQKGAEVVVLGGFQKSGDTVRLNARFVNVETGEVLHSLKLDRAVKKPEQLLDLQDAFEEEVTRAVPVIKAKMRP